MTLTRKELFVERLDEIGDFWRVCQEFATEGWTFSDFEDAGVVQDLYGFTDSTFEENLTFLRNMLLAPTIIPFLDKSAGSATDGHDFIDENEPEIEGEPHVFEETAEQPASTTQQVIVNGNVFNAKNQFFGNVENVFDS